MTDEQSHAPLKHHDAYRRAANFLSVGQILLWDNPLLKRALAQSIPQGSPTLSTSVEPTGRKCQITAEPVESGMNKLRVRPTLQLLALIASFISYAGQTAMADETKVFEWRDANGVTSYSQKPPPPEARGVTSFEVDTKTFTPAQRAAIRAHLARIDAAARADSARFREQVTVADQDVSRALMSLSQAERAARDGRAPLAGERVGTAGGGSRLRSEYFDRQKHLEDGIQKARARVEETYRLRSQIMP